MKHFKLDALMGNHKRRRKPERPYKPLWEPFESQEYTDPYPRRKDSIYALGKARKGWRKGIRICHYNVRWEIWR